MENCFKIALLLDSTSPVAPIGSKLFSADFKIDIWFQNGFGACQSGSNKILELVEARTLSLLWVSQAFYLLIMSLMVIKVK